MKFIFANLALLALQAHMTSALTSNANEAPQIMSDVCSNSGNRPNCEVELDVPASCVSGGQSDCPIVFFLHGSGGTNNWFARTSGVHTAGYIGIYPQGEGGWNTGPKTTNVCTWEDFECTEDPDEGAFIANIISKVRLEGANGNVYVIGNSNGAALAMRLASNAGTELPIKGIVTKVTQLLASPERSGPGVLNYNQPFSTSPKVSVLNIMGTGDGLIPYTGGSSGVFNGDSAFQLMDALDSMIVWAEHNGCSAVPEVTTGLSSDKGTGATFYDYKGCDEGTIVEHYAILEGGHDAGGASIDGKKIDYDIAFDFINRCEEGSTPVPPSTPPPPSTAPPVIAPTPTLLVVANNVDTRCNFENSDGVKAFDGCPATCGTCSTPPTTLAPEPAPSLPPVSSTVAPVIAPTPTPNACEDDPFWAGKFSAAHTCSYVAIDTDRRCNFENSDGVKAFDGCPVTCGTCSPPPSCIVCSDQSTPWMIESYVAIDTDRRCNFENSDGVKAFDGCPATCGTCSPPPPCIVCSDQSTPWMIENDYDCSTNSFITTNCNSSPYWINNKFCQESCYNAGKGYEGDNCCSSCEQCTDEETPWMIKNGHDCASTDW
eukprot:CAMPEP_0195305802 /NCGR_PEP_ID=MMETSP0707-20130614/36872_1 /TAXON_ID=33640 /ORGANISM="Asterionellopsis glacialis, Strain CCMP134" /LENGTH=599 /DNA_ID=CAMNT_0040370003 /DNA_START=218 /DNA_END=2015 /DNA_ORIENTATION=-